MRTFNSVEEMREYYKNPNSTLKKELDEINKKYWRSFGQSMINYPDNSGIQDQIRCKDDQSQ